MITQQAWADGGFLVQHPEDQSRAPVSFMKAYEQQLEWDGVPATTRNALLRVVSALLLGGALTPEAVPLLLGTRLAGGWKAVEVSS